MKRQADFLSIPIEIGRTGIVSELAMELGKKIVPKWSNEWECLDDNELVYYFKGVVILEDQLFPGGAGIGSATSTKFIYRTIQERHLDEEYSLADWAFQYASNPYVPFDTGNRHGAKTVFELFEWQNNYSKMREKEQRDAMIRKEEKIRLKAEAHAERLRQKEIRDKELGYK